MKPEQQRIKLAEWDGWKFHQVKGGADGWRSWHSPDGNPAHGFELPNYLSDLNAVHDLERKLNLNQLGLYADILDKVCVEVHICPLTGRL